MGTRVTLIPGVEACNAGLLRLFPPAKVHAVGLPSVPNLAYNKPSVKGQCTNCSVPLLVRYCFHVHSSVCLHAFSDLTLLVAGFILVCSLSQFVQL